MAEAKTLEYYLNNPDEMPENLSDLEASFQPQEPGEDVEKEDAPSDVKPEEVKEEVKVEEAPPAEEKEATPKLLSKNGKDEIPYQVLVSERERRAAAEKAAEDLRKQLTEIESKVTAGTQTQEAQQGNEPLDVDRLAEDFPEIGKVVKALQAQIVEANQRLQMVAEAEQERKAREVQTVRSKVQETIDANPVLRYWQAENPDMYGKAVQLDNALLQDPAIAGLGLEQRFSRVVQAMEAIYGKTDLPPQYRPTDAPKTEDMSELTEKAKEVVKKTEAFKPRSLSDIPGGSPPAASESERLQNMSTAQLSLMMQDMDADQINTLMAKLG